VQARQQQQSGFVCVCVCVFWQGVYQVVRGGDDGRTKSEDTYLLTLPTCLLKLSLSLLWIGFIPT
jgi:hypothetical protein